MTNAKTLKVFGIKNCDTVQKVLHFLNSNKLAYEFIDFKKTPPSKEQLKLWKKELGDTWLNTKGPTYRKIKDAFETASEPAKLDILIANSSAIKRPIIMRANEVLLNGNNEEKLTCLLKASSG